MKCTSTCLVLVLIRFYFKKWNKASFLGCSPVFPVLKVPYDAFSLGRRFPTVTRLWLVSQTPQKRGRSPSFTFVPGSTFQKVWDKQFCKSVPCDVTKGPYYYYYYSLITPFKFTAKLFLMSLTFSSLFFCCFYCFHLILYIFILFLVFIIFFSQSYKLELKRCCSRTEG